MSNKKYYVQLPSELIDEFELADQKELQLKVRDQGLVISANKKSAGIQNISLRWFLIPTILATLVFLGYFGYRQQFQIPLTGNISIAGLVIILGLFSGICSFFFFFIKGKRNKINTAAKNIYWRNFPTILVSFAIILVFMLAAFFWLLGLLFQGASFDLLTASLLFFVFTSVANYFMIYAALSISPGLITNVLIFVIIGGILFSMLTNRQQQWWQYNFSFLGTAEASDSWKFNLTLIFSALLMVALIDFLFVSLEHSFVKNRKLLLLRSLLTLTALTLAAVGLIPNEKGYLHELHNTAANWLVYLILILIIGIKWLLPTVSKEFLAISYMIGIVLFVCNILFQGLYYLSLTAFELIAFALAFSWLLLLLQNIQRLTQTTKPTYEVKLQVLAELPEAVEAPGADQEN